MLIRWNCLLQCISREVPTQRFVKFYSLTSKPVLTIKRKDAFNIRYKSCLTLIELVIRTLGCHSGGKQVPASQAHSIWPDWQPVWPWTPNQAFQEQRNGKCKRQLSFLLERDVNQSTPTAPSSPGKPSWMQTQKPKFRNGVWHSHTHKVKTVSEKHASLPASSSRDGPTVVKWKMFLLQFP